MKNRELFFSIIIPTYNRAGFINKTIDSLLAQQFERFELLIVDDGSTDNTQAVVESFTDERVKYFRKENGERGAARNYGAKLAKGTYVNFFDSDDMAYPNHTKEAANAAYKLNYPEVFHLGYDVKDPEGKLIRKANLPSVINDRLIDGNHLSCNGVFIRKDICQEFTFSENRILSASEDYELWLRLASRFPIYCENVTTSTVVNHDARSVLKIDLDAFLARKQILQDNLFSDEKFIKRYGHKSEIFKSYLNIYIALHLAIAGYPKKMSLQYLGMALKLRPHVLLTRRFLGALKNIIK